MYNDEDSSRYRTISRSDWGKANPEEPITKQDIDTGSLLRIADAVEKMAQNIIELEADRDRYKLWYEREKALRKKCKNCVAGLRGAITKLKAMK